MDFRYLLVCQVGIIRNSPPPCRKLLMLVLVDLHRIVLQVLSEYLQPSCGGLAHRQQGCPDSVPLLVEQARHLVDKEQHFYALGGIPIKLTRILISLPEQGHAFCFDHQAQHSSGTKKGQLSEHDDAGYETMPGNAVENLHNIKSRQDLQTRERCRQVQAVCDHLDRGAGAAAPITSPSTCGDIPQHIIDLNASNDEFREIQVHVEVPALLQTPPIVVQHATQVDKNTANQKHQLRINELEWKCIH
mmetsp:Transcript_69817/g.176550  ORF Transcript_69817/g.176550 Transcript_69817/m.176550 type:complete len:246 (+) Transcript_69817:526-1263(+)